MILSRVIELVRAQNWTAIAIDFLIVVAGLQPEFNILTGEIVDEEEETLPLLGLIVEYAW